MNNNTKGALAIILSSTTFAIMGMLVKYTGEATLFQQIFFRNLVMLLFSASLVKKSGTSFFGYKENRKYLFSRSLFGFLGVMASFYANRNLYLGDAQALFKVSPFVTTMLAVILLKERINRTTILTMLIAFTGALVVVNPKFDSRLLPSLIAIGSAFMGGTAYVFIAILARRERPEDKSTIIFMFSLWSLIFSAPFVGNIFLLRARTLFFLSMVGVTASVAQYLVTSAYSIADASKISIFDYTSLIISPILGKLVFNESLPKSSYLGILLILIAGILSYLNTRKLMVRNNY